MENKKKVIIQNSDGTTMDVELVTYLISEDEKNAYLVYSKGEKVGNENDEIIYISKLFSNNGKLEIDEIKDDEEWLDVQKLLKKIANAE